MPRRNDINLVSTHGYNHPSAALRQTEDRLRARALKHGYRLLRSGSQFFLAKDDGTAEHGPYDSIDQAGRKLSSMFRTGSWMEREVRAGMTEDRTDNDAVLCAARLNGGPIISSRIALSKAARSLRGPPRKELSREERRLRWIKKQHELHLLRRKYPEVQFDKAEANLRKGYRRRR